MSKNKMVFSTEHHKSVVQLDDNVFDQLQRVSVVTWRPGDGTDNFGGNGWLCPVDKAIMFVLSYLQGDSARHLPLRGYRAAVGQVVGNLRFGGRPQFLFDGQLTPAGGNVGKAINSQTNPSALWSLLRMHRDARRTVATGRYVPEPEKLVMPLLMVAYKKKPTAFFSDKIEQLTRHYRGWYADDVIPEAELEDACLARWEMLLRAPGTRYNPTEYWLLDSRAAVVPGDRLFYDFRGLLGVTCFNPAADLLQLKIPNPAVACMREIGVDVRNLRPDGTMRRIDEVIRNIDEAKLAAVVSRMRFVLGEDSKHFEDEQLYEAILSPNSFLSLPAKTMEGQIQRLGEDRVFLIMRSRLVAPLASVVTDSELRQACVDTDKPLVVGGACRSQVIAASTLNTEEFKFSVGQMDLSIWPDSKWGYSDARATANTQSAGKAVDLRQPADCVASLA